MTASADTLLKEITEAYEYDLNGWQAIRREAKTDMRFVAGDPWDQADKDARKNRPTVAPEELSQYRNAVINALMANPRGGRFAPTGNGANDKGAEFYQNKWREIEYRSQGVQHYLNAADNALQRSYGFVRVKVDYASPRTRNQDIWIEGFPNPDMVLPDTDAVMLDSSDMRRCFVYQWLAQSEFKRRYPKAKITNFGDFAAHNPQWIKGNKVLIAEHWRIQTKPRKLLLARYSPPGSPARQLVPSPALAAHELEIFKDEVPAALQRFPGLEVVRELRDVDYPQVWMYLTNGLEVLHEQPWIGKYIPIVSCYGKVLYVEGDQGMERTILSMTRFGRDPWKAYCYACCQELEVLGMVPKSPLLIPRQAMNAVELKAVEESTHTPKAYLTYDPTLGGAAQGHVIEAPKRADYVQAEYLQAIEIVKEGFRRAIQSAMGSNFLPTQAQRRNEKSGVALDKIDQMATQGTYHFVHAYNSLIRQTAVIGEDLMDKVYDFRGEVGVLQADDTAIRVRINDPEHQDAISTKGDYLVTVSTAPSSDSEREAVDEFVGQLVGQLERIAKVAGSKVAAAILAKAIRMRNLGPQGDQLADLVEPPEFKQKDGEPPNPQLLQAQAQIQHLTQLLQRAAQEKEAKVVEQQGKFSIEKMKVEATSADKAADREVKLAVAELGDRLDRLALFLEESKLVGARHAAAADMAHDSIERSKDRVHEHLTAAAARDHATELAAQQAEAAPQLEAGA